ncbi:MAG: ankyrin repeat domain-containing protein [Verrucomicrobia bacterium]|nr:ankyrin repeat domain-containing protein [Verrucomicrobiota bacterium]
MPNESGSWHLELFLAENGEDPVLLEAYARFGAGPRYRIEPSSIGGKKVLRAICILLLVAKDRGAEHVEPDGLLHFEVHTHHNTWLKTLGGYEHNKKAVSEDVFQKTFRQARFLEGFPGSFHSDGKKPPHAKVNPHKLPLENLKIFTRPVHDTKSRELTETDELRKLATLLEAKIVVKETGKPPEPKKSKKSKRQRKHFNKETWSGAIVPTILQQTDEMKGAVQPAEAPAPPTILPTEEITLADAKKELLYLLRKDDSEDACIALFERWSSRYRNLCTDDISERGDFPLLIAITFRRDRVVDYLLGLPHIQVNKDNAYGTTPILKAAQLNDLNLIELLLAKGAQPTAVNLQGANAIHEAAFGGTPDALETIQWFMRLGVPCKAKTKTGGHPSAFARSSETYKFLCVWDGTNEEMAKMKSIVSGGISPALRASLGLSSVPAISPKQAVPEVAPRRSEGTELFIAVREGKMDVVKQLLQSSKDAGSFDINEGRLQLQISPLHVAVVRQPPEFAELLLRRGSNPFRPDIHGRIPREYLPPTREHWRERTVESLLLRFESVWNENQYKSIPAEQCFSSWRDMPEACASSQNS